MINHVQTGGCHIYVCVCVWGGGGGGGGVIFGGGQDCHTLMNQLVYSGTSLKPPLGNVTTLAKP